MYPRSSGHCYTHMITTGTIELDPDTQPSEYILYQALVFLKNTKADLVKGDLIVFEEAAGYRNSGVTIFDGNKIIPLDYTIDDYGSLPSIFHVIENDVPITYWQDTATEHGIVHNNIVWFNHKLVLNQCGTNITYGPLPDKYAIYTWFQYNSQIYYIVLDTTDNMDDLKPSKIDYYRKKLDYILTTSKDLIIFSCYSPSYPDLTNTLFI